MLPADTLGRQSRTLQEFVKVWHHFPSHSRVRRMRGKLSNYRRSSWLVRRCQSGLCRRNTEKFQGMLGGTRMDFIDKILKCSDCGNDFVFTAGEQLFFHNKQFKNDPKHCKQCKAKRTRGSQRVRPETRTTCSECGAETTVPFKPTQGRPVLCRSCFQKQQTNQPAAPPLVQEKSAADD